MLLKSGFDLTVGPITYQNLNGVKVFGFGKASLSMATEVADILGGGAILPGSTLSAPFSATSGPTPPRGFEVYRGARNNLPDKDSAVAAERILSEIQKPPSVDRQARPFCSIVKPYLVLL